MPNAATDVRPAAAGRRRLPDDAWLWVAGLVGGLLVLGPGLGPGSLYSLDLSLTPRVPLPPGFWGLGPALPQRVPSFLPIAALSPLVGGPAAGKLFIVACVAVAFVGAARLVAEAPPVARLGAGALYAIGPFVVTRIAAGHLNVVLVGAVLPWALPHLLQPSVDLRRTFLAAALVAAGGSAGSSLVAVLLLAGLVTEPARRRVGRVMAVVAFANLVWVVPDLVVLWAGAEVRGGDTFRTHLPDLWSYGGLLAGGGFWRTDFQVGAAGVGGAVAGLVLTGLAAYGHRDLPVRWRRGSLVAAVVGVALAVASAVPGGRDVYGRLTDLPFGAPFRESQRSLLLWLVWAAPAAAAGGARLGRALVARRRAPARLAGASGRVALAAPLVLGLALAGPGLWGAQGRLEPVHQPAGWAEAARLVRAQPGTVLALPWNEYPDLSFAGGRTVFNPLPDVLGGDVLSSYDPEFSATRTQEQVDHRARTVDGLIDGLLAGRPRAGDLRRLGVRWVVLQRQADWSRYAVVLRRDPGLQLVRRDAAVEVYGVIGWRGPAVAPDGRSYGISRPIPPLLSTRAPAGSVLDVAGAPGWVRGWGHPARVTSDGRLLVPAGSGPLWFWPALLVVGIHLFVLGAAFACWRRLRSVRAPETSPSKRTNRVSGDDSCAGRVSSGTVAAS